MEETGEREREENTRERRVEGGEEIPKIEEWEVQSEINKLKLGKTPGPDNIENKMIRDYGEILTKSLTRCYNMILEGERTPTQWEISELMLIYKKGRRNEIENYRPCLLYTSPSPRDRTRSRMPSSA